MARIAVPGLIDLLTVADPAAVADLAQDRRLDRRYDARGPLVNRLQLGRIRRALKLNGAPLPPVTEHGPQRPVPAQQALESRLAELVAGGLGGPEVGALAAYVRGAGHKGDSGRLSQQLVGRLFSPDYSANATSWAAAKVLGAAPSTFNPILIVWWAITGRVAQARTQLAAKVGNDPSGLHGTGVAIHNLVEAFARMRELYKDPTARHASAAEAVGRCLQAPKQVVRQATVAGASPAGDFGADTMVVLQLRKANDQAPGYGTAFMTGVWAQCPAHRWIPAAMTEVWTQATREPHA